MTKIFIISEEILIDNQKWICDRLKEQFIRYQPNYVTNDPNEAACNGNERGWII